MEFEGRGRSVAEGFGMPSRSLPEALENARAGFDLRDPSRALTLLGELCLNVNEGSLVLMPVLLSLLKHEAPVIVKQAVVCGTRLFCSVLEEISLQLQRIGELERWLEDMWAWMLRFKDVVFGLALEPGPSSVRLLAVKFLEVHVFQLSADYTPHGGLLEEKTRGFSISKLVGLHPLFEQSLVSFEVNKSLGLLLNLLLSASTSPVQLTIVVINCLSAIARKRPVYYDRILSALLSFDPDSQTLEGGHVASVRYSLKTAFAGILRCIHHPSISESREKIIRALRSLTPGDATEHLIRQLDKAAKTAERISRDPRQSKDDKISSQQFLLSDSTISKRSMSVVSNGIPISDVGVVKRPRHGLTSSDPVPLITNLANDSEDGKVDSANGFPSKVSLLDSDLAPAEQMIVMVGALLAEGEKGAESLDILISQMQADLLADMVVLNMKHLPKSPTLYNKSGRPFSTDSVLDAADMSSQVLPSPVAPDVSSIMASDAKRDPRRDPRRQDPRRVVTIEGSMENASDVLVPTSPKIEKSISDMSTTLPDDKLTTEERPSMMEKGLSMPVETIPIEHDLEALASSDVTRNNSVDAITLESDQTSVLSSERVLEESSNELPLPPIFVDLTDEQRKLLSAVAVERIAESYKKIQAMGYDHERLCLLGRLVSQVDTSGDIIKIVERHIVKDYHHLKGHELAVNILYHLHSAMVSDDEQYKKSSSADVYEKFLLSIAKFVCSMLPASDKAFSRLLNEAPYLPDSALKLLEDLCYKLDPDQKGKDTREGDRITQGLGAVWSLILLRPNIRQNCLEIALKCAIDPQDEVRGKAIRLIANKLHPLFFVAESIEKFAKDTVLSLVDQRVSDKNTSLRPSCEEIMQAENQESSSNDSRMLDSLNTPVLSFSQAQKYSSLFFALCAKKPQLLQLVFDVYGRAPKALKQAIHWHISDLLKKVGPSCPELLQIISVFPDGSENLISLVLQVLTEEMIPSTDLIATVKQLYQSKLKDASILIPILSSLSKEEVLPVFPRLVDLPLEKFQTALARILQGSAHTGPALTPAEVLVAIHIISPEKDGVPLKKIMDACGTCFEQRTVFTQQILVKALDELIGQTPLPLLFMRTVIQAIDAYPALVDYVMEILSKLVTLQVWRMPKLWPGFLKCASQTQPHSFSVLLKLPPPQLENVLQKHPNLRNPLSNYANQGNVRTSLPRPILQVLGLSHEQHPPQQ